MRLEIDVRLGLPLRSWVRVLIFSVLALALPSGLRAAVPEGGPSAAEILHRVEDQARAEHKNILLAFGASWCGNCKLFDQFLADPQMHPILSRAFVFASMDTGSARTIQNMRIRPEAWRTRIRSAAGTPDSLSWSCWMRTAGSLWTRIAPTRR